MAPRPILTLPSPTLRDVCVPVVDFGDELADLVRDMFDTMYAAPGRGLAAPQIGVLQRVFVMDCTWKDGERSPLVYVNPEILGESEDTAVYEEGCLSIPDQLVQVVRPARVEMRWQDVDGTTHQGWLDGFAATCAQHERDHLDGILCIDYAVVE